jgi:hypothetical protein
MFRAHGRRVGVYRRGGIAWFIWGCMVFMGYVGGVNTTLFAPQLGSKVFGVVIAGICFGYAYVIWRAATVVLYSGGALVGTAVRPRWVPWDQIIDASLQPDVSGYGQRGHVPVIQLKTGRSVRLGFFFVPNGRRAERDIAVRVANALMNHLRPAS